MGFGLICTVLAGMLGRGVLARSVVIAALAATVASMWASTFLYASYDTQGMSEVRPFIVVACFTPTQIQSYPLDPQILLKQPLYFFMTAAVVDETRFLRWIACAGIMDVVSCLVQALLCECPESVGSFSTLRAKPPSFADRSTWTYYFRS